MYTTFVSMNFHFIDVCISGMFSGSVDMLTFLFGEAEPYAFCWIDHTTAGLEEVMPDTQIPLEGLDKIKKLLVFLCDADGTGVIDKCIDELHEWQ